MFFFISQIIFGATSAEILPPYLCEVRAIMEGRVAFLNEVVSFENHAERLDPFFAAYLDAKTMANHKVRTKKLELYDNIFLTAHAHVRWYEEILSLIQDPLNRANLPEMIYFLLAKGQSILSVGYDSNGTDKKLKQCDVREEKYFHQIQYRLRVGSGIDLDVRCSHYEKLVEKIMELFQSNDQIMQATQRGASDMLAKKVLTADLNPEILTIQGGAKVDDCVNHIDSYAAARDINLSFKDNFEKYRKTSVEQTLDATMRIRLLNMWAGKVKSSISLAPFKKLFDATIPLFGDIKLLNKSLLEFQNMKQRLERIEQLVEAQKDLIITESESRRKFFEQEKAFFQVLKISCESSVQRYICQDLQQVLLSNEFLLRERLMQESLDELALFKYHKEAEYSQLPWTAFLLATDYKQALEKRETAEGIAPQVIPQGFQVDSKQFFKGSDLSQCIADIFAGSAVPQVRFINALKSFGVLTTETAGGSECYYDIWDVTGKQHRAYFHLRHGSDLSIRREDWRFKNIVNLLDRAGFLGAAG